MKRSTQLVLASICLIILALLLYAPNTEEHPSVLSATVVETTKASSSLYGNKVHTLEKGSSVQIHYEFENYYMIVEPLKENLNYPFWVEKRYLRLE